MTDKPIMWLRHEMETYKANRLMVAYLTASYIYYMRPEENPIMSDPDYDWLCKRLLEKWDEITHWHRDCIVKDDLKAGTAYSLREHDYPWIARSLAVGLARGIDPKPKSLR